MQRIALALTAAIWAITALAAGPEIKFDTTDHDCGTIHANKGALSWTYKFTNTGDEPLVIISVSNGGCGCTKPAFPTEPIAPGKTGEIKITFNPEGRRGQLARKVKVRTNADAKPLLLSFKGMIIPK
ncbi:MAG: DUF1573 domain-containing protein [Paramuribaculum sp.]|nr:DUF1573 domain-containing protein [Paramuribaculum sp.]